MFSKKLCSFTLAFFSALPLISVISNPTCKAVIMSTEELIDNLCKLSEQFNNVIPDIYFLPVSLEPQKVKLFEVYDLLNFLIKYIQHGNLDGLPSWVSNKSDALCFVIEKTRSIKNKLIETGLFPVNEGNDKKMPHFEQDCIYRIKNLIEMISPQTQKEISPATKELIDSLTEPYEQFKKILHELNSSPLCSESQKLELSRICNLMYSLIKYLREGNVRVGHTFNCSNHTRAWFSTKATSVYYFILQTELITTKLFPNNGTNIPPYFSPGLIRPEHTLCPPISEEVIACYDSLVQRFSCRPGFLEEECKSKIKNLIERINTLLG